MSGKAWLVSNLLSALPRTFPNRSGTTLTEVLVSILVMSIGIVSLTSIFPLSLARSIRSAQLTNGTICRYNCDSMLDIDKSILAAVPASTNVVIDPIGYNIMSTERPALKDVFGNQPNPTPPPDFIPSGTLARLSGGRTNLADAEFLVTLPDNWSQVHEGVGSALSPTQVTVAGLSAKLASLPAGQVKVTLFYEGQGRLLSVSRIATGLSGDDISWGAALPAAVTAVGMVRVEKQNRNYTWIATVRRGALPSTSVSIDVTVFFRRAFDVKDETVYTAAFVNGVRDVTLTFAAGTQLNLRKGNYVFDPDNAYWYQIADLKGQTSTAVTLVLERPAAASSPGGSGRAILMKGIVEVFHIEEKTI